MTLLLALALAAAVPPSVEASALGRQVAEAGTLGTLLPLITAKETEELLAQHEDLGKDEQATLRALAADIAKAGSERALAANGRAYAEALTAEELKIVVAFQRSAAGRRYQAVQPQVIAATMVALAGLDFKKDVLAAFCKKTGKLC
ncbi:DUF2059 domain-containing protein [Sphingomonas sinipercae]|uniref:DUF2059 domain-containing protein n=1 Tax=Sphingomonas sinipercae TaxID=2714944 RepID=A0A6G7ZQH2_9SPHN|nr:DUF2059 domain-containing protein [Sphingomonas sinipercae]QIL03175.1 DUF2059 domain-containing protein [Sphingomonas sinipercae]